MASEKFLMFMLWCCILMSLTHCNPVGRTRSREYNAISYLTQYQYLRMPDARTGQLRTQKELREAIKMFQLYAGIPMTGDVDSKTMKMMAMPRCGMPDFGRSDSTKRRKRYAVQGTQWRKKELTYMIEENGPSNQISLAEVKEQVVRAFKAWEDISTLKFTKSENPNADILVKFRSGMHSDGYPFDGQGGTLAHAFYPDNNEGLSGDVHFDDDERWILKKSDIGTDFYWTALHEIGHALGLDHSNYKDAIMYPFYTGFKENLALNEDDIEGIRYLYGMPTIKLKTPEVMATNPMPTVFTNLHSDMPHACMVTSFDAIFTDLNRRTYFFSGKYFWVIRMSGMPEGPFLITRNWKELPSDGVDAVYRSEHRTTFFKGKLCWIYNGTRLIRGPISISNVFRNLDTSVEKIDAAFVWGANGKTYLFSGDHYWRFNEALDTIDMGYPAKISDSWVGVPNNLSSAMTWINGRTYFFKDKGFWKFDNVDIRTTHSEAMITSAYWMKCRENDGTVGTRSAASYVSTRNILILTLSYVIFSIC